MRTDAIASLALLAALSTLGACGTVDPEPAPAAPRMVAHTVDPFDETGIRPDPDAGDVLSQSSGGILVEWRRLTSEQLARTTIGGYHLYRADTNDVDGVPLNFRRIATVVEAPAGSDTTFSDTAVEPNVRYFYTVRAYSRNSGTEGEPSDTVSYTLSARPIPRSPIGNLDSADATPLRFRFGPSEVGGEVLIFLDLVHPENDRVVLETVWRSRERATFDEPTVTYSGPALTSKSHYRWRVDKVFGTQPFGNASRWVSFVAP